MTDRPWRLRGGKLLGAVVVAACITPGVAVAADCADAAHSLSETVREGLGTDAATASLRKIVAACPDLAEGHFHLGVSLLQQKHADEAVASLKKALELKKEPAYLVALGDAYAEQKQLDHAQEAFSEALKFDAKSVRAMQGLAAVAISQGRYPVAEETLRRAIQIAPDEAPLFYNLGLVLEQTGRIDEALDSFRAATLRRPSYVSAQLHLGTAAIRVGRFEDAERTLRPLTLQDGQNPLLWLALGAAADGMGQLEAAVTDVDKALSFDPQLLPAQVNRAILLVKSGHVQEGRDQLVAMSGAHENNASIQSALGWAYLQSDQLDRAEASLNKAVELDPKDGFAQNNLGVVYSLRGDSERAQRSFQKARELRPSLKEPAANIQSVIE